MFRLSICCTRMSRNEYAFLTSAVSDQTGFRIELGTHTVIVIFGIAQFIGKNIRNIRQINDNKTFASDPYIKLHKGSYPLTLSLNTERHLHDFCSLTDLS